MVYHIVLACFHDTAMNRMWGIEINAIYFTNIHSLMQWPLNSLDYVPPSVTKFEHEPQYMFVYVIYFKIFKSKT